MVKMTVEDILFQDQQVLMRVDFNVPLKGGQVANDKRIRAALPTIQHIIKSGGKLALISHLGRPKGQRRPEMSLRPCAETLASHLGRPVAFVDDCIGEAAQSSVAQLKAGEVALLENLRFHAAETQNDPDFARQLAVLGQVYVNDAFGTAHRAHASTEGVTHYLQPCVAGYLIMKEIDYLGRVLEHPQRPFVAIIGGAKISGKIDVIQNLLSKVDQLLIGGAMAFTFLSAQGLNVGKSLVEADKINLAQTLLQTAGDKLILPVDSLVAETWDMSTETVGAIQAVSNNAIPDSTAGLDIGPQTIERFQTVLTKAQTIVWNGPMGIFEIDTTAKGTYEIAQMLAQRTAQGAVTVIGGGDSAAAAEKAGLAEQISHISTGGGASLEFLEGKKLPGIEALTDKSL